MNTFCFTGNLGRDAEVAATRGGTSVCRFSVAVTTGFGEKQQTTWVECGLFGKRAEGKLPQHLTKGTKVAITGELSLDKWTGNDGQERTTLKVMVGSLDLLGGNGQGEQSQRPAQQSAPAASEVTYEDDIPF